MTKITIVSSFFFSFGDAKNVSFPEACAVIKYIFFKKYKNIFSVNCLHKWPSDVKKNKKKLKKSWT